MCHAVIGREVSPLGSFDVLDLLVVVQLFTGEEVVAGNLGERCVLGPPYLRYTPYNTIKS